MVATAGSPRIWALASALRDARTAAGITVRELARRLKLSTHTYISHWESASRVPTPEQVALVLGALGTPPEERDRILDIARNAGETNWLTVGMAGIPQQLAGVVECERAASAITEWTPLVIPGLLQTSDYMRAVKLAAELPNADVELRVMIGSGRRDVLTRRDPIKFEALICEAALYEPVGSPGVMVDQLRYLIEMANRPSIVVRVVPLRIGWHPGWAGPFVLFEFPDISPVVYFEHHSSGAFIPDEHDVLEYRNAVDRLHVVAKSPDESMSLIAKIANEMEATP